MPPLYGIQDERIQKFVFPFITIAGVLGPKIVKARALRKQNKLKNKKQESEKKGDESLQDFESRMKNKAESKVNESHQIENEDDDDHDVHIVKVL